MTDGLPTAIGYLLEVRKTCGCPNCERGKHWTLFKVTKDKKDARSFLSVELGERRVFSLLLGEDITKTEVKDYRQ